MKTATLTLLLLLVSGCAELQMLEAQYCASLTPEARKEIIAKIRETDPTYPEEGRCNDAS